MFYILITKSFLPMKKKPRCFLPQSFDFLLLFALSPVILIIIIFTKVITVAVFIIKVIAITMIIIERSVQYPHDHFLFCLFSTVVATVKQSVKVKQSSKKPKSMTRSTKKQRLEGGWEQRPIKIEQYKWKEPEIGKNLQRPSWSARLPITRRR